MTSEQHERAVESIDPSGGKFGLSSLGLDQVLDAYFASLREQGVVLVDLRGVVDWLQRSSDNPYGEPRGKLRDIADAIERRFGGNKRSE